MSALNDKWNLLYDNIPKGKANTENWKTYLKDICTVDDIHTLAYTAHSLKFDELPIGINFHFFRFNIEPAWEDENNLHGGKWVLEIMRDESTPQTNDIWMKTMAFCAGEAVDNEQITGCVISPRKHVDRIAIWTRGQNEETLKAGKLWKEKVGIENQINFLVHENSLKGLRDRVLIKYQI
ncbi:eukaryotic translation initiation factor 4E [Binucleata daphniae]